MALLKEEGFNEWAGSYDKDIPAMATEYPFDGYYQVLAFVHQQIEVVEGETKILDIGIGTGLLSLELYKAGARIYGMDFSERMLAITAEKMPNACLAAGDFANGLPPILAKEQFQYIISSYALHHIDDVGKVKFLLDLQQQLLPKGKIIIADIAFETVDDLEVCKAKNINHWDHSEFYTVAEQLQATLQQAGISSKYQQISSCGGVFVIEKKA